MKVSQIVVGLFSDVGLIVYNNSIVVHDRHIAGIGRVTIFCITGFRKIVDMGVTVVVIVESCDGIACTDHELEVIFSVLVICHEGSDHILVCVDGGIVGGSALVVIRSVAGVILAVHIFLVL